MQFQINSHNCVNIISYTVISFSYIPLFVWRNWKVLTSTLEPQVSGEDSITYAELVSRDWDDASAIDFTYSPNPGLSTKLTDQPPGILSAKKGRLTLRHKFGTVLNLFPYWVNDITLIREISEFEIFITISNFMLI